MYTKENTITIFGSKRFPGVLLDFGASQKFILSTSEEFISVQKRYGGYLIEHPNGRGEICGVIILRRINLLKLSTYNNHGKGECVSLQNIDLSGDVVNGKYKPIVSVSGYNAGKYVMEGGSVWYGPPQESEKGYWLTGATLTERPDYSLKDDGEIISTYFGNQQEKLGEGSLSSEGLLSGLILRAQRWPAIEPSHFHCHKGDIDVQLKNSNVCTASEDSDDSGVTKVGSRLVSDPFHPVVLEAILPANIYLLGRSSYIKEDLGKYTLCSYFSFPERVMAWDMPIAYKDAMSAITGKNVAQLINKAEREAFNKSGLAKKYLGEELKV